MADLRAQLQEGLSGSYALERELGRGGMATVFLARDLKHDRPVALKVLHPELAASLGPERFQREIRMAARLQHPHVLTVLDSGSVGPAGAERLWFTMPYVEGESLRERLRRERQLPVEDALRIAREAAQALQYAHEQGVIHRDIKPENLLLTRDGNTLVADFGIARALGGSSDDRLTETGLVVGTPAYMSPEQAAGDRTLDARTDVYALGSVLYEMLAGEPPFTGVSTQALMVKRLTEPAPSVRAVRPNIPEATDQAIRKALAPVPADRFATAAEFGRALAPAATTVAAASAPAARSTGQTAAARPASRPHRHRSVALLGLGFLLGLGVLFGWLRRHGDASGGAEGVKRLAVLPFDNLGSAEDEYFADGVTDEIRAKLAGVQGLQVTASRSAAEYKKSGKDLATIARELGVDYLLVGKVRWEKGEPGKSRVRVSPELIQVSTGSTRWEQPFEASLTDVFKVQSDVAGQVARALDVELGAPQREALAERPTANAAAYDAYLKGQAASRDLGTGDPLELQKAIGYYEQAVAIDSAFAQAWAALSRANSLLYFNGTPTQERAVRAREAAERALRLSPNHSRGHLALGDYYSAVPPLDYERALREYEAGLRLTPNDIDLLASSALAEISTGRWEVALEHLAQAQTLDPRSLLVARRLAYTYLRLRRFPEAIAASDRALGLDSANAQLLENKVMAYLGQGDLESARRIVRGATGTIPPTDIATYFANYYDLYWVLPAELQDLLLRLTPSAFDDRASWAIVLAQVSRARGDPRARLYADSARIAFEERLRGAPDDAQSHVVHGLALAYLGRKAEAIAEGEKGLALLPIESDSYSGPYVQHQLVRIYLLVGEPEKALDRLEPLLRIPYYLSPGWLRIDPTFDSLRKHPRFQRLVGGTT
ncbi:MAG TPA: protein kinase [Gemmatimonadales bacterium]|nr:protein kinase [Gemmatimonadales bacterium]